MNTLGSKIPESQGTYLEQKYMIPNGLSQNKLARDLERIKSVNEIFKN
ncbi:MAG: hypothetical protein J0H87_08070 [Holosporales bacterium]|nr:hypothetical protein [Holosporales bacterium]